MSISELPGEPATLHPLSDARAHLDRRTLVSAAAWSVPVVTIALAAPAASASGPLDTNLRITLTGVHSFYSEGTLPGDAALVGDIVATLLNANPGDHSAADGTLDRILYDNWEQTVNDLEAELYDYLSWGNSLGGASVVLDRARSLVSPLDANIHPIPAGTLLQALYHAPGSIITGTSDNSAVVFDPPGPLGLVASRTLASDQTSNGSLFGNINLSLDLSSDPGVVVTLDQAQYGGGEASRVTLTASIVTEDSDTSNNVATGEVVRYYSVGGSLSWRASQLFQFVYDHNYYVENDPSYWGFPTNNATLVNWAPIGAIQLFTAPLA